MAYNNKPRREEEKFDVQREQMLFYAMLQDPANQAEYRKSLGPTVDLNRWLAACRDAVEANPKLLAPSVRQSLLFAVKKAAQQTLRPDGKQGAIILRWNSDARQQLATWQPMLQGVLLLGRRAGVLKDFTAEIVFAGEPFKFLRGDDPKIVHEWMPDIREKAYGYLRVPPGQQNQGGAPDDEVAGPDFNAFWDMVVAAYCIVEGPDGSKTRRAMTRSRLLLLRDFSKSRGGPWSSVFLDEMIVKAAVHHAMKHVDTVPKDEDAGRVFRAALDQDMDADLSDIDDDVVDARVSAAPPPPALAAPNPMDKLNQLNTRLTRDKVPVEQSVVREQQPAARPMPQQPVEPPRQPPALADQDQSEALGQSEDPADEQAKAEQARAEREAKLRQKDQSAGEWVNKFLSDLDSKLDEADHTGLIEHVTQFLRNADIQGKLAGLKKHFEHHYNKVLEGCLEDRRHNMLREAQENQGSHQQLLDDILTHSLENAA